jgi:hypothetical protein
MFWDVTRPEDIHRRFGGTWFLHIQAHNPECHCENLRSNKNCPTWPYVSHFISNRSVPQWHQQNRWTIQANSLSEILLLDWIQYIWATLLTQRRLKFSIFLRCCGLYMRLSSTDSDGFLTPNFIMSCLALPIWQKFIFRFWFVFHVSAGKMDLHFGRHWVAYQSGRKV